MQAVANAGTGVLVPNNQLRKCRFVKAAVACAPRVLSAVVSGFSHLARIGEHEITCKGDRNASPPARAPVPQRGQKQYYYAAPPPAATNPAQTRPIQRASAGTEVLIIQCLAGKIAPANSTQVPQQIVSLNIAPTSSTIMHKELTYSIRTNRALSFQPLPKHSFITMFSYSLT